MSIQNEVNVLKLAIEKLSTITNEQWCATLNARKRAELEFHNQHRDRQIKAVIDTDDFEKYYGNTKYYSATARSNDYVSSWVRSNVRGKIFLDYACGDGVRAIRAAQDGAALAIGIDISDESVRNANADAKAVGLDNVVFVQADAENTCLPDNSVDVILCSGMLHHLDLSYAFPELRRILKPGGRILAVEALNCNPFIKLYRKLTKRMRTEWEATHILGLADLDFAARFFDIKEVRFWHVVGYLGAHLPLLKGTFDSLDRFVLEKIPLVNHMAWIFTFEVRSLK